MYGSGLYLVSWTQGPESEGDPECICFIVNTNQKTLVLIPCDTTAEIGVSFWTQGNIGTQKQIRTEGWIDRRT